jgi:hypothetical protein
VVKRKFTSAVSLDGGYIIDLRQRLYDSLSDGNGRSESAAGEREKLARVSRARAAIAQLAFICREEILGRELEPVPEFGEFCEFFFGILINLKFVIFIKFR